MLKREYEQSLNVKARHLFSTRKTCSDASLNAEITKVINCTIGDYETHPLNLVKICKSIYILADKNKEADRWITDLDIDGSEISHISKAHIMPKKYLKQGVVLGIEVMESGDPYSIAVLKNGDYREGRGYFDEVFPSLLK